jgi:chromosome segregation ATPase
MNAGNTTRNATSTDTAVRTRTARTGHPAKKDHAHGVSTSSETLEALRAAYQAQLAQLASERDEARREARRAKAEADVARADLASLTARVHELLSAAAHHLPRQT